jgi:hypothetical protein
MIWIAAVLAVWRLSAILSYDYWTQWLRNFAKVYQEGADGHPKTLLGKVLGCFWCSSLASSIAVLILVVLGLDWIVWLLALSGGAILLNHVTRIYREFL